MPPPHASTSVLYSKGTFDTEPSASVISLSDLTIVIITGESNVPHIPLGTIPFVNFIGIYT